MSRHLIAFAAGLSLVAAIGLAMPAAAADLDYGAAPENGSPYDDPRYADIYRHPAPKVHHDERYGREDRYSHKDERYGRDDRYGYDDDRDRYADRDDRAKDHSYKDDHDDKYVEPRRDYGYTYDRRHDDRYSGRARDYVRRDGYDNRRDAGYLPPVAPRFWGERFADRYGQAGGHHRRRAGLDERRARGECDPQQLIRHRLIRDGWRDFEPIRLGDDLAKFRATARNGQRFVVQLDRCSGEIVDLRRLRWRGDYAWRNQK